MANIPDILDGHVTLEVECVDRLYLNEPLEVPPTRSENVRRHLSPDGIRLLLQYRELQQIHPGLSLHADDAAKYFGSPDSRLRFELATRELRDRDLLWTDILPSAAGFLHGMHATELGKLVTAQIRRELSSQSSGAEPADAGVPTEEGSA